VFHPPEVSEAFLSYHSDEENIVLSFNSGLLHCSKSGQHNN
jgi:hypothetical protein